MSSPFGESRNGSPCLGCQDRKIACSDHCDRYRAWKAEQDEIKKKRRTYMNARSNDAKGGPAQMGMKILVDRLTFDGNFCDIAQCQEVPCKYPDTGCSQRQVWDQLKAIEDILGDSYELEKLKQRWGYMGLIGKTVYGIRHRYTAKLLEGVMKIYDRAASPWILKMYPGECYVAERICVRSDLAKLGSTVFLTREEAEEAIGGAHNG